MRSLLCIATFVASIAVVVGLRIGKSKGADVPEFVPMQYKDKYSIDVFQERCVQPGHKVDPNENEKCCTGLPPNKDNECWCKLPGQKAEDASECCASASTRTKYRDEDGKCKELRCGKVEPTYIPFPHPMKYRDEGTDQACVESGYKSDPNVPCCSSLAPNDNDECWCKLPGAIVSNGDECCLLHGHDVIVRDNMTCQVCNGKGKCVDDKPWNKLTKLLRQCKNDNI